MKIEDREKNVVRVTSRIGDLPVPIPSGVQLDIADGKVTVKGPKGQLVQAIMPGIGIDEKDGLVHIVNIDRNKKVKAFHGLMRALLANMVTGVTDGFQRNLIIEGVGYRAAVSGKEVEINVGYSNPVRYAIPADVAIEVEQNTRVKITGIDKCRVGQVAAEIRKIRPPEPYKGKGIRYENEKIRRKVGKSGS